MKKKHIYTMVAMVLIISIVYSISLYAKADEADNVNNSLEHFEEIYGNTYLGRGYNLLENSISFRDVSAIKTGNDVSIFEYDGENGLNSIPVKLTENKIHFDVKKFVGNSQLDYVNKYIKAYEGGVVSNEEEKNWTVGKADIDFIKDTMNQLDKTGKEIVDYSTSIAYANICSLEISEDYGNHVRKEFLDDVFNLDARSVLMKYGTHVLTAVSMGSYIENTYTLVSDNREELDVIEKYLSDYTDDYYSKEDGKINSSLSEEQEKKLLDFLNNDEKQVIINRTSIAKLQQNKGVKYNGDYEAWYREVSKKPLFIGASGNGLVKLPEIIRKICPTQEYSSKMLREKAEEIAREYEKYASEIEAEKQTKLNNKFGDFINSCVEINTTPIAIKEECGFDKKYALDDTIQALHTGYSIGKLKMYNAVLSSVDGSYKSDESCGLKLMYQIGDCLKDLPVGTAQAESHKMSISPTYVDKFKFLGSGGYYTEVEYYDGVNEILSSGENIFVKKNATKVLTILNLYDNKFLRAKVNAHGGLKKITVNVLYNTKAKLISRFFWGNNGLKVSQDWLCIYEINFTKE